MNPRRLRMGLGSLEGVGRCVVFVAFRLTLALRLCPLPVLGRILATLPESVSVPLPTSVVIPGHGGHQVPLLALLRAQLWSPSPHPGSGPEFL